MIIMLWEWNGLWYEQALAGPPGLYCVYKEKCEITSSYSSSDTLSLSTTHNYVSFPWRRHWIEGSDGFWCFLRNRGERYCQSSASRI